EFYGTVLGLRQTKCVTISGPWIDQVVGLSGVKADVIYLDLPSGPRVELIRYLHPPGVRPAGLGESNTAGLRHLAFRVMDINEVAARLRAVGVRFFSDVQRVPAEQVSYAGGRRKYLVYFQ